MVSNPRLIPWALLGLLTIQAGLLGYSARVHSPAFDEVGHLAAGISHWEFGRFELYSVNPPLVRTIAAAPVVAFGNPKMDWDYYRSDPTLRSEIFVGRQMLKLNGQRAFDYFFWARMAVLPIALAGTWLCFLWGRDLFGAAAGLLAASLWVFSPNVLAYGSIITPDLASAVSMLAASYVFWRWTKEPSWPRAFMLAGTLAVAMLTKSVWLMLPPLMLLVWSMKALWIDRQGAKSPSVGEAPSPRVWVQLSQFAIAVFVAVVLTNGFYGFDGSLRPLGEFEFVSRSLAVPGDCEDCGEQRGNRFAAGVLGNLPVPLPANYLAGIDIQRRDFERGRTDPAWKSYLWGEWKQGGWWYYYVVGLLVKVPLPIWLMLGAGSIAALFWRPSRENSVQSAWMGIACLWGPAIALFVLISANSGLNRYVRYALPVLPVLFVWASQIARREIAQQRWAAPVIGAGCLWLVATTLFSGPHWLSYFNPIAGGPKSGHEVLCDSNIDWGQDLVLLQQWLRKHPEANGNLHLAYYGVVDPAAIGVQYRLPFPMLENASERSVESHRWIGPTPGLHIVSKNYVVGHTMPVPDGTHPVRFKHFEGPAYEYFQKFEPVDRIGHSMLVYRLSLEDVNSVRSLLKLAKLRTPADEGKLSSDSPPGSGMISKAPS